MRTINIKIFTLLIIGVVALTATAVFAAKNYNSSKSNTSSIAIVNQQVGDVLLRYGVGGAEINKVTDVLAVGIDEVDLKSMLIEIGIGEKGVNEVFTKLDELGVGFIKLDDEEKAISTPDTGSAVQGVEEIEIAVEQIKRGEVSTPSTEDVQKEYDTTSPKLYEKIAPAVPAPDTGDILTSAVDSFFDVFTELEVFIEIIAKNANITKTNARKVVNVLMTVSPAFTIDENGLQELRRAELIEAIASGANLTKADAKRALDAFVGATTKSAPALYKMLITGERVALVGSGSFLISKRKARTGRITYSNITLERAVFQDTSKNIIQNIRSAVPEERKDLIEELQVNRETFQTEILSMSLSIRENAQELRDNFRENVRTVIGHVDHGKTARIANAHGKGLRMLNRFRSATARFGHILGRLESRVLKLKTQDFQVDSFFDVETSIEEANNTQVKNEAKMEELKAKYESLLLGENPQEVAEEARKIAQELKTEIEDLHAKLREIVNKIKLVMANFNSSRSNKSEN